MFYPIACKVFTKKADKMRSFHKFPVLVDSCFEVNNIEQVLFVYCWILFPQMDAKYKLVYGLHFVSIMVQVN